VVGETLDPSRRGNKALKKIESRIHSQKFASTLHLKLHAASSDIKMDAVGVEDQNNQAGSALKPSQSQYIESELVGDDS